MKRENQQRIEPTEQPPPRKVRARDLPCGERVRLFQRKLYCKAKQEKDYKFYVLYDKVFIPYFIEEAYWRVRRRGGSPGIDGQTFTSIEDDGLGKFLHELREDLRKRTYKPQAVKRVYIPKANGDKRPLGIPTIRDRVAQMACKMVIEPIFEADFEDSSYGFRPKRSAKDAIGAIKGHLKDGKTEVLDADLSGYFDTIPHDKLLKTLSLRITDKRILKLIKLWLKSPIVEDGKHRKSGDKGTPQGGVISPLLANIYMHLIDRIVNKKNSIFGRSDIKMVRYADDFILMGKEITDEAKEKLSELLDRMGLILNKTKTHQLNARKAPFKFLGFTVRYDKDIRGMGGRYWNIIPSAKSEKKMRENICVFLGKGGHFPPERVAQGLNAIVRGWINYFDIPSISYPAKSKRVLRYYLMEKLNRYYNRKSQRRSRLYGYQAYAMLVSKYGLIEPTRYSVSRRL